jgi:hypothetical protein
MAGRFVKNLSDFFAGAWADYGFYFFGGHW